MLILAGCSFLSGTAQQVAVKTNLLYWATTTPNIGVEFALDKHSTLSISGNYNPWTIGDDGRIRHWFIQPEYRHWFSEKYTHFYVGAHLIGGGFQIGRFTLPLHIVPQIANRYYEGWMIGAGISAGYQFYIAPHWNLELSAGVGVMNVHYHVENNSSYSRSRWFPMPTQAGITFVYLFRSKK